MCSGSTTTPRTPLLSAPAPSLLSLDTLAWFWRRAAFCTRATLAAGVRIPSLFASVAQTSAAWQRRETMGCWSPRSSTRATRRCVRRRPGGRYRKARWGACACASLLTRHLPGRVAQHAPEGGAAACHCGPDLHGRGGDARGTGGRRGHDKRRGAEARPRRRVRRGPRQGVCLEPPQAGWRPASCAPGAHGCEEGRNSGWERPLPLPSSPRGAAWQTRTHAVTVATTHTAGVPPTREAAPSTSRGVTTPAPPGVP